MDKYESRTVKYCSPLGCAFNNRLKNSNFSKSFILLYFYCKSRFNICGLLLLLLNNP